MIPHFPEFKSLEITDKEEIVGYTSKFLPYSDFNFTSMWCWDIDGKIMASNLDDNLVINFSDYVTSDPFYSLIGNNNIQNAVQSLRNLSEKNGVSSRLKLVPEEVAMIAREDSGLRVEEDRDNFDYIFSIENLSSMAGAKLASKRNYIKRFLRDHESSYEMLDATEAGAKEEVIRLCQDWAVYKHVSDQDLDHEIRAIERYFSMPDYENHIVLGVRVHGELIAFWSIEILNNNFAISHFQKAKLGLFKGIYPYLNQLGAQLLKEKGISFINFEQDLGIPGLREGKTDYDPVRFLKKFVIEG